MPGLCIGFMHGAHSIMQHACKTCNAWIISLRGNVAMQDMHGRIIMWDPVSIFVIMMALNLNMPVARLNVHDVVAVNQSNITVEHTANSSILREEINYER
jgi:hypothetical protein